MDRLLITGVITYIFGVLTGLYHNELKYYLMTRLTRRSKKEKKELGREIKEVDVMGKSFFIARQLQPQTTVLFNAERALIQIPNEELDKIFSEESESENKLLDIDEKLEYEDEPEVEEDIELITEEGEVELATGVTFDELGQIHEALQKECLSKKEKPAIRKMVCKVLQTDLFEMMVWQSSTGSQKVNQVLLNLFEDETITENRAGERLIDQQKLDNFQIVDFV